MSEKYHLRVKQDSGKYISPWKISNIMEDLAEEYYKKYLLDELVEKMKESTRNQIPIIFDSSFDLYQKYSKLKDFNLMNSEDLENVYYIGNVIPLEPKLKILKLNLIFSTHRSIYTLLNKSKILMDRSKLSKYVIPNFNESDEINFSSLREYLDTLLIKTKEKNEPLRNRCEKIINNAISELKSFQKYSVDFKIINSIEKEKELKEYLKDNNKRNFYNKYYGGFASIYKRYKRPIVAMLDIENGNIEILAKEFIKEDLQNDNDNKLEVVDLSRNSPTAMTYIISYLTVSWLGYIFINGLDDKKVNKMKELEEQELSIRDNPELIKLNEAIDRLQDIESTDKFAENIVHIEDYKKVRELRSINTNINKNTKETLDRNEFLNSNVEIMPIENEVDEDIDENE